MWQLSRPNLSRGTEARKSIFIEFFHMHTLKKNKFCQASSPKTWFAKATTLPVGETV